MSKDKDVLRRALSEVVGPLNQLMDSLGGSSGAMWFLELKKFLRQERCWAGGVFIRHLGTIDVPIATPASAPYQPREFFNIANPAVDSMNDSFLELIGHSFENEALTIRCGEFRREPKGIAELVAAIGEDAITTSLAAIQLLMTHQPTNLPGNLVPDGHTNYFFVRDEMGQLSVVMLYIHHGEYGGGWHLESSKDWSEIQCNERDRVFFRN